MSTEVTVKREEYRLSLKALNLGRRCCTDSVSRSERSVRPHSWREHDELRGSKTGGGEHFLEPFRVMLDDVERAGLTSLARISTVTSVFTA